MARLQLIAMLVKATGKVFGRNCDMWLMERYGTKYTARSTHPRDYKKNPQSQAEKECTLRMGVASKAYNQLVKGSPEWLALEEAWREQKDKPGGKRSIRGYFISQHMKQANTP